MSSSPPPRLVVIDMQQAFADPGSVWYCPRYDQAAAECSRLADRFAGRVIYTRFVRDPAETGSWHAYYDHWHTMRLAPHDPAWDLTLTTGPDDPVISRPTFSKWHPELQQVLPDDAPLVLCGVATDCCVLATAYAAADAGRAVTIAADACAGVSDEAHEQALALLRLVEPMITIRQTADLLAEPNAVGRLDALT